MARTYKRDSRGRFTSGGGSSGGSKRGTGGSGGRKRNKARVTTTGTFLTRGKAKIAQRERYKQFNSKTTAGRSAKEAYKAAARGARVSQGKSRPVAVMTKDAFVAKYGGGSAMNQLSFGPGGRTRMTKKQEARLTKRLQEKDRKEIDGNRRAAAAYDSLVRAGRIKPPSALDELKRKAQGHSDNESVQAARRLLEKRKARQSLNPASVAPAKKPAVKSSPLPPLPPATPAKPPKAKRAKTQKNPYANIYAQFGIK